MKNTDKIDSAVVEQNPEATMQAEDTSLKQIDDDVQSAEDVVRGDSEKHFPVVPVSELPKQGMLVVRGERPKKESKRYSL